MFGERLELRGHSEILAATAHEFGHSSATTRSNSPVDTSRFLSHEAGEANLLRLRDTDREHHVKVCVLTPQGFARGKRDLPFYNINIANTASISGDY